MPNAKSDCVHHFIVDGNRVGTCKKCGEIKDFLKAQVKAGLKDNSYNYYTRDIPYDILPYNFYKRYNREPSLTNRRPLGKYD